MPTVAGKAPAKKASKKTASKPKERRTGRRILVEDLRLNHKIVTSWHKGLPEDMTEEELVDAFLGDGDPSGRLVKTSKEVKQINLCEGKWRTHVHINKNECYDTRSYVWIVNEG